MDNKLDQPSDDLQAEEGASYTDGLKEEESPSDIKRMKKLKEKFVELIYFWYMFFYNEFIFKIRKESQKVVDNLNNCVF